MPNIEASKIDLEELLGKKLDKQKLEENLILAKSELDSVNEDNLVIDVKDSNRPDLWSIEGIARELKGRLSIKRGLPKYEVKKGKVECSIEKSVEESRPFIACAIIRDTKVSEDLLVQMIQLQEKVGLTFGRKRKECAIGLYDFDVMKPPVFYRGYKDSEIEFIPLDFKVRMAPSEVLKGHPKGKEFGHLIEGKERYPIVIDSAGVVASMPPIINSEATGKITEKTKNVFLEVTGFNWETINTALKVMVMALADRGGKIEAVKINFPKGKVYPKKSEFTPNFGTKKIKLEVNYINEITGLNLVAKEVIDLLGKARMKASKKGKNIIVDYPDYRQDILHPVDIIEEILISYRYDNIKPESIKFVTTGEELEETKKIELAREICIGLGLQEVINYTLTSKKIQEEKMNLRNAEFVEIANPVSSNWTVFRLSIIPELLNFLSRNKLYPYPQRIFEAGKTVELGKGTETGVKEKNKLCIVMSHSKANFNEMKSVLEAIALNSGLKYSLKESAIPFLAEGRSALIDSGEKKGVIGEVNQKTLDRFGLENKVTVLEMEL